jgi:hypothetical protein
MARWSSAGSQTLGCLNILVGFSSGGEQDVLEVVILTSILVSGYGLCLLYLRHNSSVLVYKGMAVSSLRLHRISNL